MRWLFRKIRQNWFGLIMSIFGVPGLIDDGKSWLDWIASWFLNLSSILAWQPSVDFWTIYSVIAMPCLLVGVCSLLWPLMRWQYRTVRFRWLEFMGKISWIDYEDAWALLRNSQYATWIDPESKQSNSIAALGSILNRSKRERMAYNTALKRVFETFKSDPDATKLEDDKVLYNETLLRDFLGKRYDEVYNNYAFKNDLPTS